MSLQSQCLVFSLIFLSLTDPLQSLQAGLTGLAGVGPLIEQRQTSTAQNTGQQTGNKKPDKQTQTQGQQAPPSDPKQVDILKRYPRVPPPTTTPQTGATQTSDQEQPKKDKGIF